GQVLEDALRALAQHGRDAGLGGLHRADAEIVRAAARQRILVRARDRRRVADLERARAQVLLARVAARLVHAAAARGVEADVVRHAGTGARQEPLLARSHGIARARG